MHHVLDRISRVASAYLFIGPPDAQKTEAAIAFAERLGCKPIDRVKIEPQGAYLKIEQIRELQTVTRYGPTTSPHFFAIVERADEMTAEAAGAFLKTLEEPAPGVVFILCVERPDRLPMTIASRCQKIIFGEASKAWQPNPEFTPFYDELKNLRGKNALELLGLSSRLDKQKDKIEDLLYSLVFFAKQELKNLKMVRILLDTIKNLKKKASFKLALDVMCLKLGEA